MSFGLITYDKDGRESFNYNRRLLKIYEHMFVKGSSFVPNNNAGLILDYNYRKLSTILFSRPIKTKYPPMIFARTKGTLIVATVRYTGSSNNWTGVLLGIGNLGIRAFAGNSTTFVRNNSDFELIVCGFETQLQTYGFGMEVYNDNGALIYNTNDKVAKVRNAGLYNWSKYYQHSVHGAGDRYYYWKESGMSYGDFFQLSGLCWGGIYFGAEFRQDIHAGILLGDVSRLRYEIMGTFFGPGFDENPINYRSTMVLDGSTIPWLH